MTCKCGKEIEGHEAGREIPLSQGKVALVDIGDFEMVNQYKWSAIKGYGDVFYAARKIIRGEKLDLLHRFIMSPPQNLQIDHINRNGLDNRRCNLRICTQSQNTANQRPQRNSSSKYKGVSWHKAAKKWQAYIKKNNTDCYLGLFEKEKDAALAYDIEARKLLGKFARLNFSKEDL